MLGYLLLILDKSATSFCYYENKNYFSSTGKLIPYSTLEKAIVFALKHDLSINFLYGKNNLPGEYEKIIETINHVKIVPLGSKYKTENCIYVIKYKDTKDFSSIKKNNEYNLILRVEKRYLKELSKIIKSLTGKFKRLNITLLEIEKYTQKDLDEYANQLQSIEKDVIKTLKKNEEIEINTITDRLFLKEMKNCDAGIKHITLAPNGNFYLCPAFYHEDEQDNIGNLETGVEIKNKQLLQLSYAPICRVCDAFHCKRCVFLNKKTTLDINTPSIQQCVVSHLERNVSKSISDLIIEKSKGFKIKIVEEIPNISYLDPFDIVKDNPNYTK